MWVNRWRVPKRKLLVVHCLYCRVSLIDSFRTDVDKLFARSAWTLEGDKGGFFDDGKRQ